MTDLIEILKQKGFRVTKPRIEILKVLEKHPITVQEIQQELISRKVSVDLASIYRTVDLLTQLEIVQSVELGDGKKRYELVSTHHHHHITCEQCGLIKDISLNEQELSSLVQEQSHFLISRHSIEFFGICPQCQ